MTQAFCINFSSTKIVMHLECLTENEIHKSNEVKDDLLRQYDKWVRLYGTRIAYNGLTKALRQVYEDREREAVGRHFWEK